MYSYKNILNEFKIKRSLLTNKIRKMNNKELEHREQKQYRKRALCRLCNGSGYVDRNKENYGKRTECPLCNGSGIVEVDIKVNVYPYQKENINLNK